MSKNESRKESKIGNGSSGSVGKVVGWNINQRSGMGGGIPSFVAEELIEQEAKINVLMETVRGKSLDDFLSVMKKAGYDFAVSRNQPENEICILWKREIYHLTAMDDTLISSRGNKNPNYLMVELEDREGNKLNVVGYRIRIGSRLSKEEYEFRAGQMRVVIEKLRKLEGPTLVVTDSNNFRRGARTKIWNLTILDSMLTGVEYERKTPDGSSIFEERSVSREFEFAEDHILTKEVSITDLAYDRDFVRRAPGIYPWGKDFKRRNMRTKQDRYIQVGYPDHAIVKGQYQIGKRKSIFTEEERSRFFELDLKVAKLREDIASGNISEEIARELEAKERISRIAAALDEE